MSGALADELRNQGRGVTGALLVVGLPSLYTMETWWLGWRLPLPYLLGYAFVGLAGVFVATRSIGFREEEQAAPSPDPARIATDFAELVLQSFVAAYVVLLAFGIVELGDSSIQVVRLGLVQVVPFGLGAAVSNRLLRDSGGGEAEAQFPRSVGVFLLGAGFLAFPVSPTEEMELMAVHAGWDRLAALLLLSLVVVHLVLHELEFRGHGGRVGNRSELAQVGTTFIAYGIGALVSVVLLASFGHFVGTTLEEAVQQTIVLSFVASLGAIAGEVVL